jgi:hypothetical protein
VDKVQFEEIIKRFDEVINLLKDSSQPLSIARRIVDGLATGIGILGVISIIDIIKSWLGG